MKTRIVSMICGLILFPLATNAQHAIKGVVKSEDGEVLYGVKISVENSYLRSISGPDGSFEFMNLEHGVYELSFSLMGFEDNVEKVAIDGKNVTANITLKSNERSQIIDEILVEAIRADEKTPTSYTNISRKEIESGNYGQDLPFLLRFTPSTVVTSDAGAGIGYTGIRIRGVDPTRTNVTVNGIPLNDSESHGVFWVNMPDFASSVENIQVQRGVGTSSNGAAAFGASINIKTNDLKKNAYGVIDNAYGSFNTWRHSVKAGTGLIDGKFSVDARLSKITSDGYIDRASSDLKSFYLSGAWIGKKSSLKANIFSGKEKTYQAWWGTPESVIKGNEQDIIDYADRNSIFGEDRDNLLNSGRTYNYYTYENEVDNYQQDHYQLHFAHRFNTKLTFKLSGHYTRGRGYYEQYRVDEGLSFFGVDTVFATQGGSVDTVTSTDLIRRRWLDNHFYGALFSLNYRKGGLNFTWGGGANQYTGAHFGEIIWSEIALGSAIRDRYYDNDAEKLEAHSYLKTTYRYKKVTYFADLQYRYIGYTFLGIDDVSGSLVEVDQTAEYNFINPKVGLMVDLNNRNNVYASFAIANREPVRADFRENTVANRPEHENLMNTEVGYRYKGRRVFANANIYHMLYKNQLVLTGQINDVGGYTRTNVDDSYRAGLELEFGYQPIKQLSISGNVTLSQNKINSFNEFVDNYDVGGQDTIPHQNTDLAFSPNIIAGLGLSYRPIKGLEVNLLGKYVGDQYLDNTSTDTRKLDAYFVSNLELSYTIKDVLFKEIVLGVLVNNLFDAKYENNGYTWGYIYGNERTVENFYYPQAGRNFLGRVTLKL